MGNHAVSVWGTFADQERAGRALNMLEAGGFRQGEIAIQKRFKQALVGFEWSQALYVRLPEGIVAGFIGGGLLAALGCLVVSRGVPPIFPLALVTGLGTVVGTVIGAFFGMLFARIEASQAAPADEDKICIGVLCFNPQAEDRAKVALRTAGAATIQRD